jgi:hypothetical protein
MGVGVVDRCWTPTTCLIHVPQSPVGLEARLLSSVPAEISGLDKLVLIMSLLLTSRPLSSPSTLSHSIPQSFFPVAARPP